MLFAGACGPAVEPSPSRGASFGHFPVRVQRPEFGALEGRLSVTVGGVAAYQVVREDARTVSFTVQGAESPGPQEVIVSSRARSISGGTLVYEPPSDPRFSRLVAFGASLTMGSQDASITIHSQTHGPAAQLARALSTGWSR